MRPAHLPDRAAELRRLLADPRSVCEQLGLAERAARQARGLIICCPWHADRRPSCSVRVADDGTIGVRCFGCDMTGDVLDLVAVVNGLDTCRDFLRVLELGAELAGVTLDGSRAKTTPPPSPRRSSVPQRAYPPAAEMAGLWETAGPVTDDAAASAYLTGRALPPAAVDRLGVIRVLPADAIVPTWASCARRPWPRTGHRLLVRAYDHLGVARSVRGWRIGSEEPKRLSPAGHLVKGLVLANARAQALLRGESRPMEIVISEGEPDWLSWSLWSDAHGEGAAVLGVFAGGWSHDVAARVPTGATVFVRVDLDRAGDQYAAVINQTLGARCDVRRLERPRKA